MRILITYASAPVKEQSFSSNPVRTKVHSACTSAPVSKSGHLRSIQGPGYEQNVAQKGKSSVPVRISTAAGSGALDVLWTGLPSTQMALKGLVGQACSQAPQPTQ